MTQWVFIPGSNFLLSLTFLLSSGIQEQALHEDRRDLVFIAFNTYKIQTRAKENVNQVRVRGWRSTVFRRSLANSALERVSL